MDDDAPPGGAARADTDDEPRPSARSNGTASSRERSAPRAHRRRHAYHRRRSTQSREAPSRSHSLAAESTAPADEALQPPASSSVAGTAYQSIPASAAWLRVPQGSVPAAAYDSIRSHAEFLFSDSNLASDAHLRSHMSPDDGSVSLGLLLTFYRIAAVSVNVAVVAHALTTSTELQLSSDCTRVARRVKFVPPPPGYADDRTVYAEALPAHAHIQALREYFSRFGIVEVVRMPRWRATRTLKGFAFVQFKYRDAAAAAVAAHDSTSTGPTSTAATSTGEGYGSAGMSYAFTVATQRMRVMFKSDWAAAKRAVKRAQALDAAESVGVQVAAVLEARGTSTAVKRPRMDAEAISTASNDDIITPGTLIKIMGVPMEAPFAELRSICSALSPPRFVDCPALFNAAQALDASAGRYTHAWVRYRCPADAAAAVAYVNSGCSTAVTAAAASGMHLCGCPLTAAMASGQEEAEYGRRVAAMRAEYARARAESSDAHGHMRARVYTGMRDWDPGASSTAAIADGVDERARAGTKRRRETLDSETGAAAGNADGSHAASD